MPCGRRLRAVRYKGRLAELQAARARSKDDSSISFSLDDIAYIWGRGAVPFPEE
jgi:hypothetical protein